MKKIFLALVVLISSVSIVSAHVTVKPSEVGIGSFQTFTVGVPVEKNVPTIGIKLVIPEGLENVTPNVKPGWKIVLTKVGTGADTKITEIFWTGGSIPAGQRDEFVFSAKVPATETALAWKAHQIYSNGEVVAWDHDPTLNTIEETNPFSVTKVINDLATTTPELVSQQRSSTDHTVAFIACALSVLALAISVKNSRRV